MKTLYIECKMGAAGDMLTAALLELIEEKTEFLNTMNRIFGDKISVTAHAATSCGICGTHIGVSLSGREELPLPEHALPTPPAHAAEAHTFPELLDAIDRLPLPEPVKEDARAVYRLIGSAEAKVHNTQIEQIHFHEVGSLDALADVVGCSLLIHMLKPDRILASPVHVGNGTVRCAHGILPVPAPATAELLKGIPFYTGEIQTELCTPTGAALLRHFASDFCPMPPMRVLTVGTGVGTKKLPAANIVRAFLGNAEPSASDTILDCSCNLDDITGEQLGFALERLMDAGALDVFYIPIQMKKNRPGILLHCLCRPQDKEIFTRLIFANTTTRGVRYQEFSRAKLESSFREQQTPYGPVRLKTSEGCGVTRAKYEYEDLKEIAKKTGLSLFQLEELL